MFHFRRIQGAGERILTHLCDILLKLCSLSDFYLTSNIASTRL